MKTQEQKVLGLLQRKRKVACWEFPVKIGVCSYTKVISNLREQKYKIKNTQTYKDGQKFSTYTLFV